MAKAEFDSEDNEETYQVRESEEIVAVPIPEKPCRDENEHQEHYWAEGYCEGRRRG